MGAFPSTPAWVFNADEEIASTPTVFGSTVLIRSLNLLYALEASDGNQLWKARSLADSELSLAPSLYKDLILVAEQNSGLAAFTQEGQLQWRNSYHESGIEDFTNSQIDDIAFAEGLVFVAHRNWYFNAYDLTNGRRRFQIPAPNRKILCLEANNEMLFTCAGENLKVYSVYDGSFLWEYALDALIGSILLDGDTLFLSVPAGDFCLIAIDIYSQSPKWQIDCTQIGGADLGQLYVYEDTLFAAGYELVALSKFDGSVRWVKDLVGPLENPAINGDKIFIRNTGTTLYSLEMLTGEEKGQLLVQANTPMSREPDRSPALAGDLLIVPFGNNKVYAYLP